MQLGLLSSHKSQRTEHASHVSVLELLLFDGLKSCLKLAHFVPQCVRVWPIPAQSDVECQYVWYVRDKHYSCLNRYRLVLLFLRIDSSRRLRANLIFFWTCTFNIIFLRFLWYTTSMAPEDPVWLISQVSLWPSYQFVWVKFKLRQLAFFTELGHNVVVYNMSITQPTPIFEVCPRVITSIAKRYSDNLQLFFGGSCIRWE